MKTWKSRFFYIVITHTLFAHLPSLWPMETEQSAKKTLPSPNAILPLGKIYYELNTLLQEIEDLKKYMEHMHLQHDVVKHSYNRTEATEHNLPVVTFHLNATKIVASLKLNLIESQVTLHAISCKDMHEYSFLNQKLNELYTACDDIIKEQIERLKVKSKDHSYMESFTQFMAPYKELVDGINKQCEHWTQTYPNYKTISKICESFDESKVRENIIQNKLGHDIYIALADSQIIKYKDDLIKALITNEKMLTNSKETLIKRFASLCNTSNGRALDPKKSNSILEEIVTKKALNKKNEIEIRFLILEHCSLAWIKEHKSFFEEAVTDIRKQISNEDTVEEMLEPQQKSSSHGELTQSLSRVHGLYIKLSQANHSHSH